MGARTPEQIIGHDAVTQLAFEGYTVLRVSAKITPNDFEQWCVARHPERDDYIDLADEYGMECASGAWPPQGSL